MLTKKARKIIKKKYVRYLLNDVESLKKEIEQNPKCREKNHHGLTNRQDLKFCLDMLKNMHVFEQALNAYEEKFYDRKINSFYGLFRESGHFHTVKDIACLYINGSYSMSSWKRSRFDDYGIDCFFVEINEHHADIVYKKLRDKNISVWKDII